jgi:HTH-type transcriptional regulator / antitoxin HigA
MQIRPIRTAADHEAALAEVERLWESEPGSPEGERLEVLSLLIEAYELEHFPIDPPEPIDAVLFRMEQLGLRRKDLEPYLGSRARVSEILGGRRCLTLPMIRRLHEGLGIPAEVLIQPVEKRPARSRRQPSKSQRRQPVRGKRISASSE